MSHHSTLTLSCLMAGSTAIAAIPICNECGVYAFQFNVLQLILSSYSLYLKKVLEVVSFGSYTSF